MSSLPDPSHVSAETRRLNPALYASPRPGNPAAAYSNAPAPQGTAAASVRAALPRVRQPNKTEKRFGDILEARKRRGEIDDYRYEAITLRWGGSMRYTPDWCIWQNNGRVLLVEVKGSHIWSRDTVRYRGCAAEWVATFDFEMWQWAKGEWRQLR